MKNISNNWWDYIDVVTYTLLSFLNNKLDSLEEVDSTYVDFSYVTRINSLFDEDQRIMFYNGTFNYFMRLENNKLLIISYEYDDDNRRYHYLFKLLAGADKFNINIDKDKRLIELTNKKQKFSYSEVSQENLVSAPEKLNLKKLRPVSFEQLLERGQISSNNIGNKVKVIK